MYLRHECCAVCLQDLNTSVRVTPPRSVRHHEFRELWKQTPVSEFSALENIRYFCIVSERCREKSGCVAVSKAATKYYGIFARFCAKLVAKLVLFLQLPYSFYQNLSTTWKNCINFDEASARKRTVFDTENCKNVKSSHQMPFVLIEFHCQKQRHFVMENLYSTRSV